MNRQITVDPAKPLKPLGVIFPPGIHQTGKMAWLPSATPWTQKGPGKSPALSAACRCCAGLRQLRMAAGAVVLWRCPGRLDTIVTGDGDAGVAHEGSCSQREFGLIIGVGVLVAVNPRPGGTELGGRGDVVAQLGFGSYQHILEDDIDGAVDMFGLVANGSFSAAGVTTDTSGALAVPAGADRLTVAQVAADGGRIGVAVGTRNRQQATAAGVDAVIVDTNGMGGMGPAIGAVGMADRAAIASRGGPPSRGGHVDRRGGAGTGGMAVGARALLASVTDLRVHAG